MSNSKNIKILFVLPTLSAGGAERVMSFLACNLNEERFDASLLVTGTDKDQAYSIKPEIPVTFLNKSAVRWAVPLLSLHIHRFKPHIVFGAIGHLTFALALLAPLFPNIKFVGRETTVVSAIQKLAKKKSKKRILPDLRARTLTKIVCQSHDMKKDFVSNFGYPANKIVIIANPVTAQFSLKQSTPDQGLLQLITVGRLSKEKGHLRILNLLFKLKRPFHYTIIGSGPEREAIFAYAKKLNLIDKITHIPFTDTVETYLTQSSLYLSGSYVEGFPNVLLESCAVGTPVLAFTAPGGTSEIIQNGVNGYIAESEDTYLDKLNYFNTADWNPVIIRQSVLSKFSEDIVIEQYEQLFMSLVP